MTSSMNTPVAGKIDRTMPGNRVFYPALDGVRGIAFLLVFFFHYAAVPWGWSGVNVFFVLSGFLITGILFDSRNDSHCARNFYVRRFLRIFPLFYGVFLAILLLYPFVHWQLSFYWLAWPLYLANFLPFISKSVFSDGSPMQLAAYAWLRPIQMPQLTFYLGHFWSLCVEEQFYLLWPWVVFKVRSRRALIILCSAVVILVPILRFVCSDSAPAWMLNADLLNRATPFQVDSLLLGGLVALLIRGPHAKRLNAIGKPFALCVAILAFSVFLKGVVLAYPNWRTGYVYPEGKFTWGLTLSNLLSASIILLALQTGSPLSRLLSFGPLRWVGRISYGAYIFHDMFHLVFRAVVLVLAAHFRFVLENFSFFMCLLALPFTLFVSWISFITFESKFLKMKDRWTMHVDSRAVVSVPVE